MAEEEKKEEQKEQTQEAKQEVKQIDIQDTKESSLSKEASGKSGWMVWVILGAVVVAGSTGGFALSQLLGGTDPVCPAAETSSAQPEEPNFEDYLSDGGKGQAPWAYDQLEPVVANLDEPGVTRYVRVTVTLEISSEMDQDKGLEFFEARKMIMRDWLTTYFAGLSLEDVRGTRNLEKIKRQIQDQLNEILFTDGKPYVKRILFKEFAVQ